MKSVALGLHGLKVSRVGLGCLKMSLKQGVACVQSAVATIQAALDTGITLLDVASMPGCTENQIAIQRAIRHQRGQVVLAVKCSPVAATRVTHRKCQDIVQACETALRRLSVDEIDLFTHNVTSSKLPIEDVMGTLEGLVQQGKVRYLGLAATEDVQLIQRAHQIHPLSVVHINYSLWNRHSEHMLIPCLRQMGVGMMAYKPFGGGFAAGSVMDIEDARIFDEDCSEEMFAQSLQLTEALDLLAVQSGMTTHQLALAWVMAQGDDIVPIFGTRSRMRIIENIETMKMPLTAMELQKLLQVSFPMGHVFVA